MGRRTFNRLAVFLLIISLIAPAPSSFVSFSSPTPSAQSSDASSPPAEEMIREVYDVSLITGDVVSVGVTNEGEYRVLGVKPYDPKNTNRAFRVFSDERGLYVIPNDVNLNRFDIELFNVKHLIEQMNVTGKRLRVIVQGSNRAQVKALLDFSLERNIQAKVVSKNLNLAVLKVETLEPKKVREVYEKLQEFNKVWLDRVVKISQDKGKKVEVEAGEVVKPLLWDSVPLIGADEAWNLGLTGEGVKIAILDTGIDSSHPTFLYPNGTSKVIANIDFTDDGDPHDFEGHGTHVASIAAGFGVQTILPNYTLNIIPRQWLGGGQPTGWRADDESWLYPLPFDFPFFGRTYNYVYVSSNGLITFEYDRSFSNSVSRLAEKKAIAVAWDDWRTDRGDGNIYIGQPTSNSVAIRWVVYHYDTGALANFEAVLYSNGTIQFNYGSCDGSVSATIGISDGQSVVIAEDVYNLNYIQSRVYVPKSSSVVLAKGVAPRALLMNVKVLNRYGYGLTSWIISGIEWAVENGADIISMSLGGPATDGTDPLSLAADWAVDAGVPVIAAAGNDGGYFTINTPGAARKAFTVGATDKSDYIAYFSSCGPTLDFRVKPEVVAPGVNIWAALASKSLLEQRVIGGHLPGLDLDGDGRFDLVPLSGTSMATPHVSGVVALLKQLNPRLTPLQIRNLIVSTALNLGYNVYEQGGGRVNVPAALDSELLVDPAVVSLGSVSGGLTTFIVTFENRGSRRLTIELMPQLQRVFYWDSWPHGVILNTTRLSLPPGRKASVLVTVNLTALPRGIYSGLIYTNYTIHGSVLHIAFGFTYSFIVTVRFVGLNGLSPMAYRPVLAIKLIAQEGEPVYFYEYTDHNGVAIFDLPSGGLYSFVGVDYVTRDYSVAWAVMDANITRSVSLTLDLSRAHRYDYIPPAPDQVIASVASGIMVRHMYGGQPFFVPLGILIYYPRNSTVYATPHSYLFSNFFVHFDRNYVHAPDLSVLLAPEIYRIGYISQGVTGSVQIRPNPDQLAKFEREYRVAVTPHIAAFLYHYITITLGDYWLGLPAFGWNITSPRRLVEYYGVLTSHGINIDLFNLHTFYGKTKDLPNVYTPEFIYYLYESVVPGLRRVAFNAHPLSPHAFITVRGDGSLQVISDVFSVEGFSLTTGHLTRGWLYTDVGRLVVKVNGTLVADKDFGDITSTEHQIRLPAQIEVLLEGRSRMFLSSYAVTNITFTAAGDLHIRNPIALQVLELDLNNTHPGGPATVRVFSNWHRFGNVTLRYSFDGVNWQLATLVSQTEREALFRFPTSPGTYVSMRLNAAFDGALIDYTVYDAFYVAPTAFYTLFDFPQPFVDEFGEASNTLILVGASDRRGPCSAAHTIDVAAGMYLAYALGLRAEKGVPGIMMDWQAVHFNSTHAYRIYRPGHVIAIGGLGVNLATWYYHFLTYRGLQRLPAYMAADAQGVFIYSPASRNIYRMVNDYGQGLPVTDYAMIVLHYDPVDNRYVLIVAGLSGYSSLEAGKWLAQYPRIAARGVILRFTDSQGDGLIDRVEIAETIP